jgi:arylsulfatase A-like enzyme
VKIHRFFGAGLTGKGPVRAFFGWACLLLTLLGWGMAKTEAQTPSTKPDHINFLFVYLDDQRYDAMSFLQKLEGDKARFPWIKTPNMDKLASEGVWFRNAFATDSLCSPSRASFLTGEYPHIHGVTNNHEPLPPNTVTYATLLHAAGYYTGFIGKWHMGSQQDRPGFDFAASFIGQGHYYNCPILIDGGKETVISKKWVDDTDTDYAVDFLTKHKDQPFVLAVAFKAVHGPLQPDTPDIGLYDSEQAGTTPNMSVAASFRAPFNSKPLVTNPKRTGPYFDCLAGADRNLGRLMDTLDSLGLSQNTMIIFTSDNGYDLGEHELGDKRAAYEESMRIPFIIRAPWIANSAGKVVDQMALNIDVAPTMLDYAGVPIPKAMQGRSLRPLLEQTNVADWSRSFLYEYFFEHHFLFPTMVAVRTDTSKLITYPNHPEWTEMFKLDSDPYEIHNLAGDPDQKELLDQLQTELDRLKDTVAYVVPGDSDKDTYVEDAERDEKNPRHPRENPGSETPGPGFEKKLPTGGEGEGGGGG